MREFEPIGEYPTAKRKANRTILNRIAASNRDQEFYDGDRMNGYGGYTDDGRWSKVAANLMSVYSLNADSSVLQIGCHKGYLLKAFSDRGLSVRGTETSVYAIEHSPYSVRNFIKQVPTFTSVPFGSKEFDLVLAMSPVYMLTLTDAIRCLQEIQRVSRGNSFITLGAYDGPEDRALLEKWFLLAGTVLTKPEWVEVMKHAGYTGDWKFETAQTLNLV